MIAKTVLIVGGAGYIGSHASWVLHQNGCKVIILDALLHGQNINQPWAEFFGYDFSDERVLKKIFTKNNVDCVMHFAAFIEVGESVKNPQKFYQNNVIKTLILLNSMLEHDVKKIIFSSSCAVYGAPQKLPLDEKHILAPINPYGKNKLAVEFALQDYSTAYGLKYVSLRYFNAAGALVAKGLGEQHVPETHIIPILLHAALDNKEFVIFGNDYPTTDGTCIRDYVHVLDIAQAHVLAYKYLCAKGQSDYFNLGSESGFSVNQLITTAEKMCNKNIKIKISGRRMGDAPVLIANSAKACDVLGWKPKYSDLNEILYSALEWEKLKNQHNLKFKFDHKIC